MYKRITTKRIYNRIIYTINKFNQKKFELFLDINKFNKIQRQVLPKKALFNISNVCTSNCIFCAYQYNHDPAMIMSNDLFELCCRQYSELQPNSWISLTPIIGEPFTDKEIFKKIELAKKYKIKRVEIYSNATLLKKYADEILNSRLDELYISFPDFDEREYEIIFRTGQYKNSIEGIYELLKKHRSKNSNLLIRLNIRGRKKLEAINKEKDFVEYIKPFLSDKVTIEVTKNYDNWCGQIKQSDLPQGMRLLKDIKILKGHPCMRLFKVMFLANGDVKLCGCRCKETIFDDLVIGNIYSNSLVDIWFNEKVYELRNKFFIGEYPEVCINCTHYKYLDNRYFKEYKKAIYL